MGGITCEMVGGMSKQNPTGFYSVEVRDREGLEYGLDPVTPVLFTFSRLKRATKNAAYSWSIPLEIAENPDFVEWVLSNGKSVICGFNELKRKMKSFSAMKNPLTRVKIMSPPQRPAYANKDPDYKPSPRLIKRRRVTAKAPKGFYANPSQRLPASQFFAVKLNAGNDRNGNGRRGWIVFEILDGVEPRPAGFCDESGMGSSALKREWGDVPAVGVFDISATQYAALKKQPEMLIGAAARSRAMY
jgi:hypothetical protein